MALATTLVGAVPASAATAQYTVSPITNLSAQCNGQNAEVEQATDPNLGYVYDDWMGCTGIAFARSTNGASPSTPPSHCRARSART